MKLNTTKGFTLIELMIVVAIIGVMMTIASLNWQKYTANATLQSAARDLVSDMNAMKQGAISKFGTTYTITFNKGSNTYTKTGTTVETISLDSLGHGIQIYSLPAGASNYPLTFLARGILDPASGTIELRNDRGSSARITFNTTGKTYVKFDKK